MVRRQGVAGMAMAARARELQRVTEKGLERARGRGTRQVGPRRCLEEVMARAATVAAVKRPLARDSLPPLEVKARAGRWRVVARWRRCLEGKAERWSCPRQALGTRMGTQGRPHCRA